MYLIQEGTLLEIKGGKHPISDLQKEDKRIFTKHSFSLQMPTCFYFFRI
jgi:hypothetical protein